MCFLTDNIYDYYNVSQGKITIPNMDDGEEFSLTDVSFFLNRNVLNVDKLISTTTPHHASCFFLKKIMCILLDHPQNQYYGRIEFYIHPLLQPRTQNTTK